MGGNVTFLQDVQDAYAKLAELAIVLIKKDGHEVTAASNHSHLTKILYNQWGDSKHYQEFLQPLQGIQQPTVVDNRMGLKMIVAPIQVNSDCTYYFLAGYFLEKDARAFIQEYVKEHFPDMDDLIDAIEFTEELAEVEINRKCAFVEKLVNIAETYFSSLGEQPPGIQSSQSSSFIYQHLEGIRNKDVSVTCFIEEMYHLYDEIDFIGLAIEKENAEYQVDVIHGHNSNQLRGHTFIMGEGFLGHTLAAEQFQFWQDVGRDPRVTFFKRHGIYPRSLFCVPIFQDEKVIGILFGGSTEHKIMDGFMIDQVKAHSALLSVMVTNQHLREKLHNHLMELSTFNEVFRVMITVKEIKRVLYILVDISLNILRGPFACIV
ncbi:PocR ligand-binding domain-containing protein, partial [Halalkalibacter wakoensis]|uniref:PocR ligand-binding domain-containing protein n=1 Tax=Halalkalibacter wakoensis TaxID=127891 RepID=UPI000551AAEE